MSLPKIKVEKTPIDKTIEILTVLVILGMVVLIGITYYQLPAKVPINFNWPTVDADGLGEKSVLWVSPIVHAVICIGIYFLSKFPWLFNYPVKTYKILFVRPDRNSCSYFPIRFFSNPT